jgi:hypothetical protein
VFPPQQIWQYCSALAVFYHDTLHKSTITFSDSQDIFHRQPQEAPCGQPEERTKTGLKYCVQRTFTFEQKNELVTVRVTDKWYTYTTKDQKGQLAPVDLVQLKEMYVCTN